MLDSDGYGSQVYTVVKNSAAMSNPFINQFDYSPVEKKLTFNREFGIYSTNQSYDVTDIKRLWVLGDTLLVLNGRHVDRFAVTQDWLTFVETIADSVDGVIPCLQQIVYRDDVANKLHRIQGITDYEVEYGYGAVAVQFLTDEDCRVVKPVTDGYRIYFIKKTQDFDHGGGMTYNLDMFTEQFGCFLIILSSSAAGASHRVIYKNPQTLDDIFQIDGYRGLLGSAVSDTDIGFSYVAETQMAYVTSRNYLCYWGATSSEQFKNVQFSVKPMAAFGVGTRQVLFVSDDDGPLKTALDISSGGLAYITDGGVFLESSQLVELALSRESESNVERLFSAADGIAFV